MRYNFIPITKPIIKKTDNKSVDKDAEKWEHSYFASGNVKWTSHSGKYPIDTSKFKHIATIWPH